MSPDLVQEIYMQPKRYFWDHSFLGGRSEAERRLPMLSHRRQAKSLKSVEEETSFAQIY
jgi:hypothetical protein